jgi:hypothetical protein
MASAMSDKNNIPESAPYDNFVSMMDPVVKTKQKNLLTTLGLEDEEVVLDDIEKLKKKDDWRKYWIGMPEFRQEENPAFKTIYLHFRNEEDYKAFAKLVEQNLSMNTKSIWYPKLDREENSLLRWIEEND